MPGLTRGGAPQLVRYWSGTDLPSPASADREMSFEDLMMMEAMAQIREVRACGRQSEQANSPLRRSSSSGYQHAPSRLSDTMPPAPDSGRAGQRDLPGGADGFSQGVGAQCPEPPMIQRACPSHTWRESSASSPQARRESFSDATCKISPSHFRRSGKPTTSCNRDRLWPSRTGPKRVLPRSKRSRGATGELLTRQLLGCNVHTISQQ